MVIFVFGSNTSGIHGAGVARFARQNFGAEMGVGEGPTGLAYALPTKYRKGDGTLATRSLLNVKMSIGYFLEYAEEHPEMRFKVTRVGCGLAGFTDQQIAPCFQGASPNCGFDPAWSSFGLRTWAEAGIAD